MFNFGITKVRKVYKRGHTGKFRMGKRAYLPEVRIIHFGGGGEGLWFYLHGGAWAAPGVLTNPEHMAHFTALKG